MMLFTIHMRKDLAEAAPAATDMTCPLGLASERLSGYVHTLVRRRAS